MASDRPHRKLTYEDFVRIPDDGRRHEILDGAHVVSPSPNSRHQLISGYLQAKLWTFVDAHRLALVFSAPFDVVLSKDEIVEPDLLFHSVGRAAILTARTCRELPIWRSRSSRRAPGAAIWERNAPGTNCSACWSTGSSTPRPPACWSSGEKARASSRPSCSRPRVTIA